MAHESVLVGKSVDTLATSGTALFANGQIDSSVDGNYVAKFNRKSSDGTIIELRKDTTGIVGSIGVVDGDNLFIGSSASDHAGFYFNNTNVKPYVNGAVSDNTMNIGASAERFKDIFISGGVYLGGTGSANKLEDYEEGTHSATFAMNGSGSISMLRQNIGYVKVGRLVTITGEVSISSVSSPVGSMTMTLPFIISANVSGRDTFFGAKPVAYRVPHVQDNTPVILGNTANAQVTFVYEQDNAPFAAYTPAANATFNMSFSYLTTA